MTLIEKLPKLIGRMEHLVTYLDNRPDLIIHRQIDQSYHMQKIVELKILLGQFEEVTKKVDTLTSYIDSHYRQCFAQWKKDILWLHARQLLERSRPIV
jgi:hypothetical protein